VSRPAIRWREHQPDDHDDDHDRGRPRPILRNDLYRESAL
jgi:hypothetical protein